MVKLYPIVGAEYTGKTSVVERLGELGYHTTQDPSKDIFEEWDNNVQFRNPYFWGELDTLARNIWRAHYKIEEAILRESEKSVPVFMDGASANIIAHQIQHHGMAKVYDVHSHNYNKYEKVFFLEQLVDQIPKSLNQAQEWRINFDQKAFLSAYRRDLNYEVVEVPVMSVQERATFILENL